MTDPKRPIDQLGERLSSEASGVRAAADSLGASAPVRLTKPGASSPIAFFCHKCGSRLERSPLAAADSMECFCRTCEEARIASPAGVTAVMNLPALPPKGNKPRLPPTRAEVERKPFP